MLQVAAAGGDAALYDRYVAAAKAALGRAEQYYRVFNALASFRAPALADRTVAFALSAEVRSQDAPTLLGQLLNSSARDKTWTALSSQWDTVAERLGDFQALPYIVSSLGGFCTARSAPPKSARSSPPIRCPPLHAAWPRRWSASTPAWRWTSANPGRSPLGSPAQPKSWDSSRGPVCGS